MVLSPRRAKPGGAKMTPSLRVASKIPRLDVARLANRTTIRFAPRLDTRDFGLTTRCVAMALTGPCLADVAVTKYHPFLRGQSFQPHRPARMEFVGADADLGTQTVFVAVGEAG